MTIKGIKKAVGDFNRLNAGGTYSPRYGYLMFDSETGEVWTDEFYDLGHGSWNNYESETIVNIWNEVIREFGSVTMANVKRYIERLIEEK